MSRVNKFPEGHQPPRESWDVPKKKRKRRVKPAKKRRSSEGATTDSGNLNYPPG